MLLLQRYVNTMNVTWFGILVFVKSGKKEFKQFYGKMSYGNKKH